MGDTQARLDSDQLSETMVKLKTMFENCGEAIHIVLTGCLTGAPDEKLRPVFLKQIMGVFQTQKGLMDEQLNNMDTLTRLANQYIADHASASAGF